MTETKKPLKTFELFFNRQVVVTINALDLDDALFEAWRSFAKYMEQGNCVLKLAEKKAVKNV